MHNALFRLYKAVAYFFLGILFCLVTYVILAFILGTIPTNDTQQAHQPEIDIYIWSNGVHTDFVVPIKSSVIDWENYFSYSDFDYVVPWATHITFGWGDKAFYIQTKHWSDITFATSFNALFTTSPSVMHVSYVTHPVAVEKVRTLNLSTEQYKKLVSYLLRSLNLAESSRPVRVPVDGYGHNDAFYEAVGSYSFVNTCNEWVGEGLRQTGIKTGRWTPFTGNIFFHLKKTPKSPGN